MAADRHHQGNRFPAGADRHPQLRERERIQSDAQSFYDGASDHGTSLSARSTDRRRNYYIRVRNFSFEFCFHGCVHFSRIAPNHLLCAQV